MNFVSVFGNVFSKVEFFGYVYDVETELILAAQDVNKDVMSRAVQLNICRMILNSYGWTGEYQKWIADGAGVTEACASLAQNLAAL